MADGDVIIRIRQILEGNAPEEATRQIKAYLDAQRGATQEARNATAQNQALDSSVTRVNGGLRMLQGAVNGTAEGWRTFASGASAVFAGLGKLSIVGNVIFLLGSLASTLTTIAKRFGEAGKAAKDVAPEMDALREKLAALDKVKLEALKAQVDKIATRLDDAAKKADAALQHVQKLDELQTQKDQADRTAAAELAKAAEADEWKRKKIDLDKEGQDIEAAHAEKLQAIEREKETSRKKTYGDMDEEAGRVQAEITKRASRFADAKDARDAARKAAIDAGAISADEAASPEGVLRSYAAARLATSDAQGQAETEKRRLEQQQQSGRLPWWEYEKQRAAIEGKVNQAVSREAAIKTLVSAERENQAASREYSPEWSAQMRDELAKKRAAAEAEHAQVVAVQNKAADVETAQYTAAQLAHANKVAAYERDRPKTREETLAGIHTALVGAVVQPKFGRADVPGMTRADTAPAGPAAVSGRAQQLISQAEAAVKNGANEQEVFDKLMSLLSQLAGQGLRLTGTLESFASQFDQLDGRIGNLETTAKNASGREKANRANDP